MICLAMAVINHRQPEGTASTHGKESGVAHQSSHRVCMGMYAQTCVYYVNVSVWMGSILCMYKHTFVGFIFEGAHLGSKLCSYYLL